MTRFNQSRSGANTTTNHEGAKAYKLTPELELYTAVCCGSLQPKFYTGVDEQLGQIRSLIKRVDPEFTQKLAIYAREKMFMRSMPLVLCVELAAQNKLQKETVERVVQRADEITELLSYYQMANGRKGTKKLGKLSKQIQKGIKQVFESGKFNEYHFAKYNRDTDVKFRDALFLTHPRPQDDDQKTLFQKIVEGNLEAPYTWEVELSRLGQQSFENADAKKAAFKAKWEELIESKKIGYMALLRNLRNILEAGVSGRHIEMVNDFLSDPDAVHKSRQFPFRYLSAYKVLMNEISSEYAPMVENTLEDAIRASVDNIPGYGVDTRVLIACDTSGSMGSRLSDRSDMSYQDVGLTMGMLLQSKCKLVISGIFGESWKVVQLPQKNILQNVDTLRKYSGLVGHSTNGWRAIEWLIQQGKAVDKVMVFTDEQLWDSTSYSRRSTHNFANLWAQYKRDINPDAKMYMFDLAGYGNTPIQIDENDVYLIAGWSQEIFNMLKNLEEGQKVVDIIKSQV